MQLGMIGLGRMGANLARRLMRDGHEIVVFDVNSGSVRQLGSEGAVGARTLEGFVARLDAPRTAWIVVPAGFVQGTVDRLAGLLDAGDVIIDGGNSYYRDDIDRWRALAPKGIHFVDAGTSGGVGVRGQGRFAPLLERMPVRVILNDRTALIGAALAAAS